MVGVPLWQECAAFGLSCGSLRAFLRGNLLPSALARTYAERWRPKCGADEGDWTMRVMRTCSLLVATALGLVVACASSDDGGSSKPAAKEDVATAEQAI